MSWWIKETIAQEVRNNYSYALLEIECDDFASLPSYDQTSSLQIQIARGSKAEVLENSKTYKLNSSNVWVEQKSGLEISADYIVYDNTSSGLTATNVQDAIDEIKDLDDMQDRALTELYAEDANKQLEINYAINTGAKNLLQYNGYGTGAENGVTYTINSDGTITVNGMPQGSSPSYIELKLNGNSVNVSRFCDGQHILSGCPAGGSDSTYRMYAARSTYSRFDYGDGVLLTNTTLTDVRLVVYIANGYTANNLVFKPMIRRAEITDNTFQPYAPTNRELYEMILALQSGRSLQSLNSPMTLNLSRNDLNESLDSNFDLIDSIPEEEEGEEDV